MISINLPSFEIKLSGTRERPLIYDMLRRKYVALTPEEWVRQHFVNWLTVWKHCPAALMANEVQLRVGQKRLRADSVLYDRSLKPLMVVEYKAPSVALDERVLAQVSSYNLLLRAPFLAVSNGLEHRFLRFDEAQGRYIFVDEVPDYEQLSSLLPSSQAHSAE